MSVHSDGHVDGQGKVSHAITDQLYDEALRLAEESRTYFSRYSKTDRAELGPIDRVLYTAESLRISTRLMQVISWSMVRKAVVTGDMTAEDARKPERQLDDLELCAGSDPRSLRKLPRAVVILSHRSLNIYKRALRLQGQLIASPEGEDKVSVSPVANRLQSLEGKLQLA
ncbi:MAG: DUF1465 family protein [Sphingomonadales bacterium]